MTFIACTSELRHSGRLVTEIQVWDQIKRSTVKEMEIIWLKQIIIRSDCVFEDPTGSELKMLSLFSENIFMTYFFSFLFFLFNYV